MLTPKPHSTNVLFLSDLHLGAPTQEASRERERHVVAFLENERATLVALYLVGDIFDYWYEYKYVVPKGYIRLLGLLASLADDGVPIFFFTGNHDLWAGSYLEDEVGVTLYKEPQIHLINNKRFYIAHGDGLGPGDHGFKRMKSVFKNSWAQRAYSLLHPDAATALATLASGTSRGSNPSDTKWYGLEREWLIQHSLQLMEKLEIDYFIYGHRHYPISFQISNRSTYCNLGDWLIYDSYARWDGSRLSLSSASNKILPTLPAELQKFTAS